MNSILRALSIWYQLLPGSLLLEAECDVLSTLLPACHGDHIVLVGGSPSMAHLRSSPILHQVHFDVSASDHVAVSQVLVDVVDLPLLPHSVDVIVLAHVLEASDKPSLLLEQVYDSLAPGGYVIVVAMNCWSWWGVKRLIKGKKGFPWHLNFLSSRQLRHLLQREKFSVDCRKHCFFRPPLSSDSLMERLLWMEQLGSWLCPGLGASSIVLAQKTTSALIERKKKRIWHGKPTFHPVIKSSARVIDYHSKHISE